MTFAPLPGWRALRAALGPASATWSDLTAPWRGDGVVAGWTSRTTWSIALIVQWRRARGADPVVWVPEYFCNAALEPLRATGTRLVFFPVTDAAEPAIQACRDLAKAAKPDVVIVPHYMGRPSALAPIKELCAQHGAWLVEDAAQALRPGAGVGGAGDFVVYSPHKFLPIPDGSVLVARSKGPARLDEATVASFGDAASWPGQLEILWSALPASRRASDTASRSWLAKRALQKAGVRRAPPAIPFEESGCDVGPALLHPAPSETSRRLLSREVGDLAAVARQRHRNQLATDTLVAEASSLNLRAMGRPAHREWTPYLLGFQVDGDAASTFHDLLGRGVPVSTWPDLPPEVVADKSSVAWRLRHERLHLPVHQSIDIDAIRRGLEAV